MPDIDRAKFAYHVAARLVKAGADGPRSAQHLFPAVKAATWSRVAHGRNLSDGNFAAICKVLDLDARDFVDMGARNRFDIEGHFAAPKDWGGKAGRPAGTRKMTDGETANEV